MAYEIEN
ncbi:3f8dddf9-3b71-4a2d-b17d-18686e72c8e3 [Thermothielavioides terrestris]|nr:3f8dddf9-3b71-4a2d-b17d-18686e72c8e3 [Thermothielavioides terrestris]